ncbi:MAG: hypothetical protein ACRYG2_09620 [Janthinobacterium lividum]
MSTRLDLPPERDLPATRHRELRAELLRATRAPRRRPGVRRAWRAVVPVALVALVVAVVLGLTQPWVVTPPVVGVPSVSPSVDPRPTRGPTSTPAPAPAVPTARSIDRGPLDQTARAKAIAMCQSSLGRSTRVAQVHFARRTSTDGDVVLFTGRDGLSYACSASGASLYGGSGSTTGPLPEPSRRRPVIRITSPGPGGSRSSNGSARSYTETYYRVGPEVASLQLRLRVEGHTGAWFEASVDGGYAWAAAYVEYSTQKRGAFPHDFTIDDRAFDADGHELAIDRTPR